MPQTWHVRSTPSWLRSSLSSAKFPRQRRKRSSSPCVRQINTRYVFFSLHCIAYRHLSSRCAATCVEQIGYRRWRAVHMFFHGCSLRLFIKASIFTSLTIIAGGCLVIGRSKHTKRHSYKSHTRQFLYFEHSRLFVVFFRTLPCK